MKYFNRKELKRSAKSNLKRNFLACFVICLLFAFISNGPTAITQTAEDSKKILEGISDVLPTDTLSKGVDFLVQGIDKVKDATSIGDESKKGALHSVYSLVEESGNIIQISTKFTKAITDRSGVSVFVATAISLLALALLRVFVLDLMYIGTNRFFLENRIYQNTKISNLLYIYRIRKIWHVALVVMLKYIFLFLWSLTIVGFFIKRYSYYMVTYIVAENPEIPIREAFHLSKKMMHGYKWRTFILEVTFIPWRLLSLLTFGILGYLFLTPYIYATKAELYAAIREKAYETKIEHVELLDDKYLFVAPVTLFDDENSEDYEEGVYLATEDKLKTSSGRTWLHFSPKAHYTIINLLFMFFLFSFIGWAWECTLEYFKQGFFVNRGTMWGPWVPIYGAGGVMMIVLLNRFQSKPLFTFFAGVVIAGIMEYSTATYLWYVDHLKYWDYSGYYLNIQGRICLEGLLFFGIMGLSGIYFFAPLADNLLEKIPLKIRKIIITVLIVAFAADKTIVTIDPRTGQGITY